MGDGTQSKSYLHIDDCIKAFLFGLRHARAKVEIFNVGTDDKVSVKAIAKIVVDEMGLKDVQFRFTGGYEGRGWRGDVRVMLLDASKLKNLGWRPKYNSHEAVRMAARSMLKEVKCQNPSTDIS